MWTWNWLPACVACCAVGACGHPEHGAFCFGLVWKGVSVGRNSKGYGGLHELKLFYRGAALDACRNAPPSFLACLPWSCVATGCSSRVYRPCWIVWRSQQGTVQGNELIHWPGGKKEVLNTTLCTAYHVLNQRHLSKSLGQAKGSSPALPCLGCVYTYACLYTQFWGLCATYCGLH